jgi:hypothetical protein
MLAALAMGNNQWDASSLEDMSISQLSGMLQQRGARCVGCVEKDDFLAKLRELEVEDEMAPSARGSSCRRAVQTWDGLTGGTLSWPQSGLGNALERAAVQWDFRERPGGPMGLHEG